jgi:hypothetical protein
MQGAAEIQVPDRLDVGPVLAMTVSWKACELKNDPNYHEQWPRPLVPYKRIHSTLTGRKLTIQVADHDRNVTKIERTFSVR